MLTEEHEINNFVNSIWRDRLEDLIKKDKENRNNRHSTVFYDDGLNI